MEKLRNMLYIYTIGSFVYSMIEIIFRGHTHWTMVIAGGLVFLLLYKLGKLTEQRYYTTQIIIFTVFITSVEFVLGVLLNRILRMNVWDYSNRPLNIIGQINLFNSLLWLLLSIPCVVICKRLRNRFRQQ